jgi:hypothetical protein
MSKLLITLSFAILLVVCAMLVSAKDSIKIKGRLAPKHKKEVLQRVKYDYSRHKNFKSGDALPEFFDWAHIMDLPIGDMNQCGTSTVSFSLTGTIAGVAMVHHALDKATAMSAAQLTDCFSQGGGIGGDCCGSEPTTIIDGLIKYGKGLIATNASYPYVGNITQGSPGRCRLPGSNGFVVGAKVTGFVPLPNDEVKIQEYLYRYGPVSVVIDPTILETYTGGIISGSQCAFNYYEHMLSITGFGVSNVNGTQVKYWVARNEWGPNWGAEWMNQGKGYVLLERGVNCTGLAGMANSVTVA